VLYQATTEFSRFDYTPLTRIASWRPRSFSSIDAIEDALAGRLLPHRVELPSRRRFRPTLWEAMC